VSTGTKQCVAQVPGIVAAMLHLFLSTFPVMLGTNCPFRHRKMQCYHCCKPTHAAAVVLKPIHYMYLLWLPQIPQHPSPTAGAFSLGCTNKFHVALKPESTSWQETDRLLSPFVYSLSSVAKAMQDRNIWQCLHFLHCTLLPWMVTSILTVHRTCWRSEFPDGLI
jgi:hypothetical protein